MSGVWNEPSVPDTKQAMGARAPGAGLTCVSREQQAVPCSEVAAIPREQTTASEKAVPQSWPAHPGCAASSPQPLPWQVNCSLQSIQGKQHRLPLNKRRCLATRPAPRETGVHSPEHLPWRVPKVYRKFYCLVSNSRQIRVRGSPELQLSMQPRGHQCTRLIAC
jgi:hypothetical protein